MQNKIFYIACFGFLFGVLVRSFLFFNIYFVILCGVVALALFLFFSLISKSKWGVLAAIFVLTFCFGVFRFNMVDVTNPANFESQVGQKETFQGIVVDEPSIAPTDQHLMVKVSQGTEATEILISTGLDQTFAYGDEINFTGKLKKPENFLTDEGKTFDYIDYLRKDGILYVMSFPQVAVVSHGNGNFIKSALFYAKEKFLQKMSYVIPTPESIFMVGILLGERSDFDQNLKNNFVNTGMIHLITISGYKVTMLASWLMALFSFLPINFAILMGIFAICLFVLLTGAPATALRAGIMAILALVARATGRNYDIARALVLTALVMVLLNPFILFYDVSFQLSFIGTVAIIFYLPKIKKYFSWITPRFGLQEIVAITAAIYIFVSPYIMYEIGNFSIVALPANILIMPFFPLTMIFGFLTGLVGIISAFISVPFGYISYIFLHYELGVINFLSGLPFASFSFAGFPLWLTILIYLYFTYMLFGRSIKSFFMENY